MHDAVRGALLGLLIAAPVGPIGLLCIIRTVRNGWTAGFASGMGAATADLCYAGVAGFAMKTAVATFAAISLPFHVLGAAFLCYLGYRNITSRIVSSADTVKSLGVVSAYGTTLALTLVNPATIFSFLAIFAAAIGPDGHSTDNIWALIAGVFVGSAAWWLTLSCAVSVARAMLNVSTITVINKISGVLLIGSAIWALLPH